MCMLTLENSELSRTCVQASQDLWQTCIIHELLFSLLGLVDFKEICKVGGANSSVTFMIFFSFEIVSQAV